MEKLQIFLKDSGMSVEQFANACGVSSRSVSNWLSGKKKPTNNFDIISNITEGKVTANDFYNTPAKGGK